VEIAVGGGISAILTAMKNFPSDPLVQHHGALSVMNLAFNSGV